jgi:membrane associated rhomboid family serine protease
VVIPVHDENEEARAAGRPWVTWGLVVITVLAFLYLSMLSTLGAVLVAFHFGLVPALVTGSVNAEDFQPLIPLPLTLVTYMFLHPSWLHLAANTIILWVFGDNVEAATGHIRFLALYLLSGIAGGIAHVLSNPQSELPVVGASGAVAGVVGAYLMLRPFAKVTVLLLGAITVRLHAFWVLGAWILWQVAHVFLLRTTDDVAYWSHLGGFAAGVVLLLAFRRPDVKLFDTFRPARWHY